MNAQDRVVAQMRLFDGLSVAEIARSLAIEQKPLYRRILQIMAQLRTELERLGFSRDRLRDFLDGGVS